MAQNPKPQTLGHDRRGCRYSLYNALEGRAQHRQEVQSQAAYDKFIRGQRSPDYTPVVRAVAETNPDIFFLRVLPARHRRHRARQPRDRLQAEDLSAEAWSACRPLPSRLSSGRSSQRYHRAHDFRPPFVASPPTRAARSCRAPVRAAAPPARTSWASTFRPSPDALMQVVEQAVKGAGRPRKTPSSPSSCARPTFKTVVGDIKLNAEGEWQEAAGHGGAVPRRPAATASTSSANPSTEM